MSDDVPTIEVRVLGPLEVRRHGRLITVSGTKPRAILTILGLQPRQVLPSIVVQDILWGGAAPRTAEKALLTHVATLRRALGNGVVLTKGSGWRLDVDTDTREFEGACRAGREALRAGRMSTAVQHFSRALELWRGPPDLPATPRAQAELTRWMETYEAVIDDRVDALLGCGMSAELIGDLEAAVAQTPLRERRWAQLCLALYRAGRQGDALQTYRRARAVLAEELGVEPGPALRQLEAAILQHDAALDLPIRLFGDGASLGEHGALGDRPGAEERIPVGEPMSLPRRGRPPAPPAPTNLPVPPTAFIGRRDELDRLRELVEQHRLVTITGPGGVGKTRLAIAAGTEYANRHCVPSWFVDLAPVRRDVVSQAVAAAVGSVDDPAQPPEQSLYTYFGDGPVVLILDNCEHLIDVVSGFTERLLANCPGLIVLATSRERLHTPLEHVFALAPLATTGNRAGPDQSEAARLFIARARAVEPDFDPDLDTVEAVCARCDGLPLAIELAAARSGSIGLDGLLAGLDDHIRVLVGPRAAPERHRSVRAVLDWSYQLLDADEQAIFRQVSQFTGSFDLEAAVAMTENRTRAEVVDLIGRLTDKSLLIHERTVTGSRWRMLNVVRSYASERLATCEEHGAVRSRYLAWATATAVRLESQLQEGRSWRGEFDLVSADLRTALAGETEHDLGLTLALALAGLFARRGAFTFAQAAYEQAMALARWSGDADQLARAALGASTPGMLFGVTQARRVALLEEALAARRTEPSDLRVRLLARLATELYWSGGRKRSRELAAEAAAMADRVDSVAASAHATYALQYVSRTPGGWRRSLELAERVIDLAVASGETQLELAGRAAHAVALLEAGEIDHMDAEVAALGEAADRREHPEFQWYAAVYRLVRALLAGRFTEAEQLAASAAGAARHAPEFAVGLFFAEIVTDLREHAPDLASNRALRLAEMAEQFPRVVVWRCRQLLDQASGPRRGEVAARASAIASQLLQQPHRDGHWLLGCCLLAEVVAELGDANFAPALAEALRPYADSFAVAGRVAAFRGSVSHALGLLGLVQGTYDRAVADLEVAVRQHTRIGATPFLKRSREALHRARKLAGD